MKFKKWAASVAVAAGMSSLLGAPAQAGEARVLTNYFLCDYDDASSSGYLYIRNDNTRFTCFAYAGRADVWIGNSAYWCSFNNAGRIEYQRPDIVRGSVTFGKNQCSGFDPGTTVTSVTIF